MSGSLIVVTGPMFAGKSTRLGYFLDEKQIAIDSQPDKYTGFLKFASPKVFNNEKDRARRGDVPAIYTHGKKEYPAEWLGEFEIEAYLREDLASLLQHDMIIIDEVQFFRKQTIIAFVEALQVKGVHVCVAGLAQDSYGQPFGAMGELMAMADKIYLERAICSLCGAQASRTQRLVNREGTILVGGESMFAPRCTYHWTANPIDNG
jgi:thymidine kinase